MKSIKVDNTKTGWVELPGDTQKIIAHFKDGHTETFELFEFISLKQRVKNQIIQIDCYSATEHTPNELYSAHDNNI